MSLPDNELNVPHHIGIIPDGNRRWAKAKGVPAFEGHRRGLEISREIGLAALDRGVKVMSMYAFSTENWKRTTEEVGYLMDIFLNFLVNEFHQFEERGVRLQFAGKREGLSAKLVAAIDKVEARTAELTNGTFVLCLNYGGQQELADAAAELIRRGVPATDVTPDVLASALYAPNVPPVDLVIRTSGEQRISGFMLWRAAYAEMVFVDKSWPDFTTADLDEALAIFSDRQRRFGK